MAASKSMNSNQFFRMTFRPFAQNLKKVKFKFKVGFKVSLCTRLLMKKFNLQLMNNSVKGKLCTCTKYTMLCQYFNDAAACLKFLYGNVVHQGDIKFNG